ncbi:hypothetical protein Tsubulata_024898 [Turnera subulata]|uniref:ABC transporter domain-containing protein n=1 Tax=Turnera subulata TaxID=218843 RepID=A0A9Q0F0E9_9ROSI|nr:hypothetical protein Tsubulata_024898 [Turnera subulata]
MSVEAECELVHGTPLPTLWNTLKNSIRGITTAPGCKSQATKLEILKNISGIIKPSRMTLLLGPPGCGKTTLLKALAGKLDQSLKVTGEITYNGYKFNEFVPQKTSAYISQYDRHIPEMTVRETLDFSARCQGVGDRADIMEEICRKEKQAGIIPEPDIDTYMKAISVEGLKRSLQTDYIIKVVSEKDQAQYWQHQEVPYTFVSVDKFVNLFHKFHVGQKLTEELSIPSTKVETDKNALSFDVYPSRWELFKACMDREWLLVKRNSFVHVSKSSQVFFSIPYSFPVASSVSLDVPSYCFHSSESISGFVSSANVTIGQQVLKERGLDYSMVLPFEPVTISFQNVQYFVDTPKEFVAEVLEMIELQENKDALVGMPGVSGISMEQRKRLTIAVELVSNPAIIFMDEPTTSLDARAAAIVMRVVKNIVKTNRTIVCTIHQPSIDVFETFDELILMKRGGQVIYSGELGQHSSKLIEYFESIPGVPKIKENYNPGTWMLDITNPSAEALLGLDFARLYQESHLFRENEELVNKLRTPPEGSKELQFSTRFPQNGWQQFKACLWKQTLSYWRSPNYNLARFAFVTASSLIFGALLWQKGQKIQNEQDLLDILRSVFIFIQFIGIGNGSSVIPFVGTERIVVYRESIWYNTTNLFSGYVIPGPIEILKNINGIIKPLRMTPLLGPAVCGKNQIQWVCSSQGISLHNIPNREPSFHNHHGTKATSVDGEAPGENGGEVMDDDQLQWAAVERLPTVKRVRLSLFEDDDHKKGNSAVVDQEAAARKRVVDVTRLGALERHVFIERLITKIEEDNLRLLTKFKERIDRMTLLLGPPGCGKTTLLKALAGKLDQSLKVTGEITYNGYKFNEFVPQKTSAYISQYDRHIPEMTVRETLDFSARCQGVGDRADIMEEICRKEKQAGIIPEPDIDTYMKAISVEGLKRSLQTDYIIKVVSEKDQAQYWQHQEVPYTFVSDDKFVNLFHKFHVGQKLTEELSIPSAKAETNKKALSFDVYPSRWELFKACMDREWLLMKRNSFVHVFKTSQVFFSIPYSFPVASSVSLAVPSYCFHSSESISGFVLGSLRRSYDILIWWIHNPTMSVAWIMDYSQYWIYIGAGLIKGYIFYKEFVAEVLEMIELDEIKDALVGMPGVSGISTEQRKRLTIAVELVSNPAVIFMDEPTTGLDARAVAIVMRVVKNIVKTNRTILILMKRGGQVNIQGNLLNILRLASVISSSRRENEELVNKLRTPPEGSKELQFSTRFPQNGWQQFKACLWKQSLSYWRSPNYNLGRFAFVIVSSLIFGALLWQKGQKISSVLPFVATKRIVEYRERFAGMYSSWAYSLAQKFRTYYFKQHCSRRLHIRQLTYAGRLTKHFVASIFASLWYNIMNLFSGYPIPSPLMPKWWRRPWELKRMTPPITNGESSFNNHGPQASISEGEAPGENGGADMDDQLQWAAVERLPTFRRVRLSLFQDDDKKDNTVIDHKAAARKRVVDVTKLGALERHVFIDRLITKIEEDNLRLLTKFKERIDRVGVDLPTLEVRYRNMSVEAEFEVVHGTSHPTLWNTLKNSIRGIASAPTCKSQATKIEILKNISGIIKPSRMTLLLGPPGCGKTTLLKALAGKLDQSLKVTGEITYNGFKFNEFVPHKTSAYISQYDRHIPEMTVRETLDFSARCQGIGDRAVIMEEICRKEKQAGIIPEPDIDTYMKAISVEGLKRSLQTDYIIKVLSEKDQAQYWHRHEVPYTFVSPDTFVNLFQKFHVGQKLIEELSRPSTRAETNRKALSFDVYPSRWELFKACMDREWLLMKRNSFVHISKTTQVLFTFPAPFPDTSSVSLAVPSCCFPSSESIARFTLFALHRYDNIPIWWIHNSTKWGFWLSPISYAEIGICLNEFLAPRWQKVSSSNVTIGQQVLEQRGLNYSNYFYWISVGALLGFWMIFNIGFTFALGYFKGKFHTITLHSKCLATKLTPLVGNLKYSFAAPGRSGATISREKLANLQRREDVSTVFQEKELNYDFPETSATTEKTSETFCLTNSDSNYNAGMVLPFEPVTISFKNVQYFVDTPKEFVAQVLEMFELDEIKGALVGMSGISGISTEQRKRLTIAVELVSNPAVIFMDEPTTGLDARAAAIVMRVVKNIVKTNRTIVCTIHQPSIDVFEAFDELILLKRGGQVIYSGELGQHSSKLIAYFESIPRVPKIKENYNPGTWMLEITSPSTEARLGLDFAHLYQESPLFQENEDLVNKLSTPSEGSKELQFSTRFPQNGWQQFKACLWKQSLSYWRSPYYNLARLAFVTVTSLIFGVLLWQKGQKMTFLHLHPIRRSRQLFICAPICSQRADYCVPRKVCRNVTVEIPYIFLQSILFTAITFPAVNFYWSAYKLFWYFYTMFCSLLCFNYMGLLLVSLTPSYQVASIFASFCYNITNLFAGYAIPGRHMPKWWIWLYWICPTSWSLKGLFTSQYGDIEKEITALGERKAISAFLQSYFGYHYDDLGVVAVVLLSSSQNNHERRHPISDGEAPGENGGEDMDLQWAAVERLPTFRRVRLSLFEDDDNKKGNSTVVDQEAAARKRVVDVTKLGALERHVFIERLITKIEEDNLRLLTKFKERIDRVGLDLPTLEVRYQNLRVEVECEVVHGTPLPTLWNTVKNTIRGLASAPTCKSQATKIEILKNISGIIKPSRMTLLLGPPGCGKTTLLKALAGKLDQSLKVTGEITYNGYKFNEFVPHKTSAYISQYDRHIPEMTVRETLDFSARCQGIGDRADIMEEICRKEKQAGIIPEPDIDTYMKTKTALSCFKVQKLMYFQTGNFSRGIEKVVSEKDQAQYWHQHEVPYTFVSVDKFVNLFQKFLVGQKLIDELSRPSTKAETNKNALSFDVYPSRWELFKACMDREWLLMKRNSFVHISKTTQKGAKREIITVSPFKKIFFLFILYISHSLNDSQVLFTFPAPFPDTSSVSRALSSYCFPSSESIPRRKLFSPHRYDSIPIWWIHYSTTWGFWLSPISYAEIGICLNEFLAPRWQKVSSSNVTIGQQVLERRGLNYSNYFYWISRKLADLKRREDLNFELPKTSATTTEKTRMVLPFEPVKISFKDEFVAEVLEMIELDEIKDALVGMPGISGISTEQRKRLTIAVELVSNPAVIFMDEPTTGLDARAAAIVMRVVKNIVKTNRTIVCTIHQPSIDVFEAFDELILLKRGGQLIYSGELGQHSSKLIEYFQSIPRVPKIKENYNPGTWMLEITSPSAEARLGLDFAHLYQESPLFQENEDLVNKLSIPPEGSKELQFSTRFPQNGWQQFKACLWKQSLSYWRSPYYNLGRLAVVALCSLIFGALLWQKGQKMSRQLYICAPICSHRADCCVPRKVTIEIPYIFLQSTLFTAITFPAVNFYWSAHKLFWYFYTMFCSLLCFNYMGLLLVSLTPSYPVASILASFCFNITNLFAGYAIPGRLMPKWWVWLYWICPTSWSLKALFTSQYGDIEKEITALGERKAISAFLQSYFGYHYDDLGVVAVVLLVFPLLFAEKTPWAPRFISMRAELQTQSPLKEMATIPRMISCSGLRLKGCLQPEGLGCHCLMIMLSKMPTTKTQLGRRWSMSPSLEMWNGTFSSISLLGRLKKIIAGICALKLNVKLFMGHPSPLFGTLFEGITHVTGCKSQATKIEILKNISGIIKPSRMTLILGPPGCGKTTLLKALAGKLNQSLEVTGEITYNGYKFNEFVPQKTSAYISQYDQHISEMTVRETLDFSARCQGIGNRADLMEEICRKEKEAGIIPEPDVDTYMKAISVEGLKRSLRTDYILKVLLSILPPFHGTSSVDFVVPTYCFPSSKSFHRFILCSLLHINHAPLRWIYKIGISLNEFLAPRWQKVSSSNVTMGQVALEQRGLDYNDSFYWISLAALLGFWMIFNVGFTFALSYLEGMVLPFEPVTISFQNVHYFVETPKEFVAEVLEMIELDEIKDALVGNPGVNGISTEQRKRLTIAVELVSNPAIIFMDEPTTGLDARAAAIVMRVVKNIVKTNRTVVCTIHQPSIDVFESFDELILMKNGGQVAYSGGLGQYSSKLIDYFEGIPGVPKIKENYNPATWMLEVTNPSSEAQLENDFATMKTATVVLTRYFVISSFSCRENEELNGWQQYKACLWKQSLSYWRSPKDNLARLAFATVSSLIFGALSWRKGQQIDDEQDLFNILGSLYIFIQIIGSGNCSSVLPSLAKERIVVYRERFAGMYSSLAFSLAQITAEIPYTFLQAALFTAIAYPAVNFYWSAYKAFWCFYTMFCTFLYFNYMGLLLASLTSTFQVASVYASFCYNLMNLFAGYLIPGPIMPKWWVWLYWICPTSWSLKGIFTSLYGDIGKEISAYGERKPISAFLRSYFGASVAESTHGNGDDTHDDQLQWAALERLPTTRRVRMSLLDDSVVKDGDHQDPIRKKVVDVTKLGDEERHVFIDKLIRKIEEDNRRLLTKFKERIDRVAVELPTLEVRYRNLCVEAECEVVHGTPIPTIWNTLRNTVCGITHLTRCKSQATKIEILKNISGIIMPSRMTLLLGPPGCGKTTLLKALAGKLDQSLEVTGEIMYNGYKFSEFVPQKTSAYISQYDQHISEMTVRETLDFSARCQDLMEEVCRKEKQAGIIPEPDIDTYMKVLLSILPPFHGTSSVDFVVPTYCFPSSKSFHRFILCSLLHINHAPLRWAFWLSPLAYAEIGISLNEFLAPRWQKVSSSNVTMGQVALEQRGLDYDDSYSWISLAALLGFWMIFNVGFTFALSYLEGMVLPFEPVTISFQNVNYFVETPKEFVAEVLEMIELDEIKDALVGDPGVSGISTEQRKRLTIAVELVSNPAIIFMDEPTTSLDARAAAIVMRVVKNIVKTNRTVVCTIHQPSIDVFEAFDELILMKNGGQVIYSGELGQYSSKLIEYFEGFLGVPKIKENYNPATWMENEELVRKLRIPPQGSRELQFPTRFSQNGWQQYKACLWKQSLSYWRSPKENLARLAFVTLSSLIFGALCWQKGQQMITLHFPTNHRIGQLFSCAPIFGQREDRYVSRKIRRNITAEIPYTFLLAALFSAITYPAIMPKWWVWFYWICPTSWSLKGILTSQYGDIGKEISAYGERKPISAFLRSYFGYNHDDLGLVAVVLLAFPAAFAITFAIAIAKLNFQKR